MKREKLPKTHKKLENLLSRANSLGFEAGYKAAKSEISNLNLEYVRKQQATRLAALEGMTKLANSLGQAMDAMAHAMQSENGQL